ncbi:MAG: alpha/beta fold hydrolase [Acidimicrobiia bacterium]|nr:alpha/beta fold hydrolase [Acidimicrobiia bacterium]
MAHGPRRRRTPRGDPDPDDGGRHAGGRGRPRSHDDVHGSPGPPDLTADPPPSVPVEVPVPGGPTLSGRLFEGGPVGILLVHPFETGGGGPTSVEEITPVGAAFARAGYTVLMVDLRGHGASPGERDHEPLEGDVAAMHAALLDTGVEETFVIAWGVSGTAAVADVAAGTIDPAGLIGLFVRPQYLGLDVMEVLPEATTPMLFVSVEAGRSTRWAIRMLGVMPEGVGSTVELPSSRGDPLRDLWPFVVEEALDFIEATGA